MKSLLFNPELGLTDKIRSRREQFLLTMPLLSLIYQKKGASNFQLVVEHTRLVKADFGETVISCQEDRTFNILLRGTVMLFTKQKRGEQPHFYRKLMTGDYFGETMQFGKESLESARSVCLSYLLQIDLKFFYHIFSGHFQCEEFIDRVNFLK